VLIDATEIHTGPPRRGSLGSETPIWRRFTWLAIHRMGDATLVTESRAGLKQIFITSTLRYSW
jgi:hypothetical protein